MSEAARRWTFVSDLHLDHRVWTERSHEKRCGTAAQVSQKDHSKSFAEFALAVADQSRGEPKVEDHLVMLGDTFEIVGVSRDPSQEGAPSDVATSALKRILGQNSEAVASLGYARGAGVHIDIVAGNHDVDLNRPQLAEEIDAWTAPTDTSSIAGNLLVHAWIIHVPGVFYAEHGSQHHELNRFPDVLMPLSNDGSGRMYMPAGAFLSHPRPRFRPEAAAALVRAFVALMHSRRPHRSDPDYCARLRELSETAALPESLLRLVHDASRRGPGTTVWRVLRRAVRKPSVHDYMVAGARRVAAVLASGGLSPRVMVFGHVHDAVSIPLGIDDVVYLNTGTWSTLARGAQRAERGDRGMPYVCVLHQGDRVSWSLRWWDEGTPASKPPLLRLPA